MIFASQERPLNAFSAAARSGPLFGKIVVAKKASVREEVGPSSRICSGENASVTPNAFMSSMESPGLPVSVIIEAKRARRDSADGCIPNRCFSFK